MADAERGALPTPAARRRTAVRPVLAGLLVLAVGLLPIQGLRPHDRVTISDLVLLAAALVALVVPSGRPARTWYPRWILGGLVLMAVGGAIGLARADEVGHSAGLLLRLLGVAVLCLFVVGRWDPSAREVRTALTAYVGVAAVSAVVGTIAATTEADALSDYQNGVGRAVGLAENANLFGAVTAVAVAAGAVLAAFAPRRQLPLWLLAEAALLAGIAWSGSRSALVGAVAGVAPLAVLLVRTRGRTAVLVVGAVVLVGFGLALAGVVRVPVVDRLLERHDTAASARAEESTDVRIGQIEQGFEQRGEVSLLVGSGLRDDNPTALHNGHLEVWMALGLIGVLGWLAILATTAAPAVRLAVDHLDDAAADVARRAAASGFLGYAVTATLVDNIWNRYIWLLVALVAVLGSRAAWRAQVQGSPAEAASAS
jgi:hypothetical protein